MAAQAFAEAAVLSGHHAQAFPYFGAERRGAPVRAFARVDDAKITIKSQIYEPDLVVILDESLLEIDPVVDGLKAEGRAVVNTMKGPEELDLGVSVDCAAVDASIIALETIKAPIVNTAILGALARMTDLVTIEAVKQAISDRFGEKLGPQAAAANSLAAELAYQRAKVGRCKGERPIVQRKVWLPDWEKVPPGVVLAQDSVEGVAIGPGSSLTNFTGTWRTVTPRYLKEKCIRCLRCWFCCPEGCIKRQPDDYEKWDYRYCKGCGICSNVCPVQAIVMEKGVKEW
ncbi:MAG: Pyruvate/ketoisovalerate oxidoreductases common subunit gamma [Methanomassiliicoccales archaeon PtaU1.Bin124]|nr:MAG: Pyruvate/ketoisovalerate oxidoreductases common subunit gamma [Methanomassiliicoccales archaeon PtaU1.Bin124]